jgi:hypothetical protein
MGVRTKGKEFDKSTATGTRRDHMIEEQGMGEMFKELTPMQKAIGKLIGKILNKDTRSYEQIEEAFTWFEVEHNEGKQLGYPEKIMVIMQAAGTLGGDQRIYNLIRKMYLTVANRS